MNYKTENEPAKGVQAAALGHLAVTLGPESVLNQPNPKIYTNLSLLVIQRGKNI